MNPDKIFRWIVRKLAGGWSGKVVIVVKGGKISRFQVTQDYELDVELVV